MKNCAFREIINRHKTRAITVHSYASQLLFRQNLRQILLRFDFQSIVQRNDQYDESYCMTVTLIELLVPNPF